uniref:probable G-protein coupled receptor 139 n=1 Tax=Pristiophorus japonicus TaxID=55135 RepID=UPI00398E4992
MDLNLRSVAWKDATLDGRFIWRFDYFVENYHYYSLKTRVIVAIQMTQMFYYPLLAIVGIPVNILTIVILSRGKCGLSKCVTRYLLAMSAADLLVIILDLVLRQIPIRYAEYFQFVYLIRVCNIHSVLLYTTTDCSVWFTVTFTFDRFVAICCQKLKTKYCTERTAAVVLGTVTVLSFLKDITWYFMLSDTYGFANSPWPCGGRNNVMFSKIWGSIESLHYLLNPCVPFVVILLLNALTIRYILVASRARRRLRGPSSAETPRDPEMESRRKSIILLLVVSANFILLWSMLTVYSITRRLYVLDVQSTPLLDTWVVELGFMLQLLSCCTNTAIYAVTQTKFREQFKNMLKYPFTLIVKFIKR